MSWLLFKSLSGNKPLRTPKGQSKMDNPQKLATFGTQDEEKKHKKNPKHNTHTNKPAL